MINYSVDLDSCFRRNDDKGTHSCLKTCVFSLLVVLACALFSLPALAQSVVVTPITPQKFADPDQFLTVVFSLRNTGAAADTYNLSASVPPTWTVVSPLFPVSLAAGVAQNVFLTVLIPSTASSERFTVSLTASSQLFVGVSSVANALVDVRPLARVGVRAPLGQNVLPGGSVTYTFAVENRGNVPDIFLISARSSRGFGLQIVPVQVGLLPGERQNVTVSFSVPLGAAAGVDQLTLRATSSVTPGVETQASVVTQILPPTANAVVGSLFLTLPAQLGLQLSRDLVSRRDTLSANFNTNGALGNARLNLGASIGDLLKTAQLDTLDVSVSAIPDDGFRFSLGRTRNGSNSVSGTVRFPLGSVSVNYFNSSATTFAIVTPQTPTLTTGTPRAISNVSISALAGSRTGGFSFGGHMTLSDVFGQTDRSGAFDLNFHLADFQSQAEFFLTGPQFNGAGTDVEGFRFRGGVNTPSFIALPSFEFSNNNVNKTLQTPSQALVVTLKTKSRIVTGLALPELPSVRLDISTEKTQTSSNALGVVLTGPTRFVERRTLSISQVLGQNSISMSQGHERVEDQLTGDIFVTDSSTISGRLGQFSPLIFTFSLAEATTTNIATTPLTVTDHTFNKRLGLLVRGGLFNTEMNVTLDDKRMLFSTSLAFSPSQNLQLTLGFNISFLTLGPANASKTLTLGISSRFDLPLPFAIKGRLEGRVWVDTNNNGAFDPNEEPLSGLVVNASGARVSTDAQGFYRTPPLEPGTLSVSLEQLPAGLSPSVALPLQRRLSAGQTLSVDLPLKRVSFITGQVFNDANRNGVQDSGEGGVPGVRVRLSGPDTTLQTTSNANGRLGFADLAPGSYALTLDKNSLPPRFEPTTPRALTVALGAGGQASVQWGVAQKARRIVITFRPPQAAFGFSPQAPRAGQAVRFDAAASNDPDGFVQLYEWDFDNDGKTDATGVQAEHVFATAGTFEVTLSVTDNDGNQGVVTRTVVVTP